MDIGKYKGKTMAIFKKSFEPKLIYVYRINDEAHEAWLINHKRENDEEFGNSLISFCNS